MTDYALFRLKYLAASILDPVTKLPAFTPEQVEQLGGKNMKVLGRIFEEATTLNLDTQDAFEQAEKN